MAKHRNAVSVSCRLQNVEPACNAGGSSSLHTIMNATARLMQTLQCAPTHLKTSHRLLHHASNTQRRQALARQAHRKPQHAPLQPHRFFKRPRVTRSIATSAQLHDMRAMRMPAGAVVSRWHANAAQGSMKRTRPLKEYSTTKQPKGGSTSCRR
jgi:hypothetical protein